MFDGPTRKLIEQAPELEGLPPEALAEVLSRAFTQLVATRLALATGGTDDQALTPTLDRLRALANTYDALTCLLPTDSPNRAGAAFVAGTAYLLLHRASAYRKESTLLSRSQISPAVSAGLLFLIAGALPDAAAAAGELGEVGRSIVDILAHSVRALAKGRLASLWK